MTAENLLKYGYFPKELPPCFSTELLAQKINQINTVVARNKTTAENAFINNDIHLIPPSDQADEISIRKVVFRNRINYSDCSLFNIPKSGLSRNTIKIPNPLHKVQLAEEISNNFDQLCSIYAKSTISSTKPIIETERGEGKRAVKHDDYRVYKEKCITNSFKYSFRLKSDISSFYPSIYTHSIPWVTFGGKELYKKKWASGSRKFTYGDDLDDRLMWCQNQQTKKQKVYL
jgi:hypothetical protein